VSDLPKIATKSVD